jgi:hypothetical protein
MTGRKYYYKVRAYHSLDTTTEVGTTYGHYSAVHSATALPGAPSLTAGPAGATSIGLSWSAVPGATRYQVFRGSSATAGFTMLASTTATSFVNAGRVTGRTYYYRVRVYHQEGAARVFGAYSATRSAKAVSK